MRILPARPAHLPDILRMVQALSAFHGDTAQATLETLQTTLFNPDRATAFVAQIDGKLVGYAGLTFTPILHEGSVRIDIHHLYVAESYRSRGVGKALIAAARDFAQETGASRLTIGTDPENTGAHAAYRAMGLTEITGAGPRFRVPLDDQ